MFEFNAERVRANVREATTEDLLDRATVSSDGMEPEALDIIEAELSRRGVTRQDLEAHADRYRRENTLPPGEGPPPRCSFCDRPAVAQRWGWHRLQGRGLAGVLTSLLPLYRPRFLSYCAAHRPAPPGEGRAPGPEDGSTSC
jgi:hypothetical protein